MFSSIHTPTPNSTPSLILVKLCYQTKAPPPSQIFLPSSPYLVERTLYHKHQHSFLNIQHHLLSKTILNSLNHLTHKPPYSLFEQIVFQLIQSIFLKSSLPPEKIIKNRFDRRNYTCGSLQEGKKID